MSKDTCPLFLPGNSLCSAKFDKYGKEDMAKVEMFVYSGTKFCRYAYNCSFDTCPDYKEKTEKK